MRVNQVTNNDDDYDDDANYNKYNNNEKSEL